MLNEVLLGDDFNKIGTVLKKTINGDKVSPLKKKMRTAKDYFEFKHDILNFKLFYFDKLGKLVEEKNRSNIKIPHPFLYEQVNQKVQYMLSNPIDVIVEDDEEFQAELDEYFDESFQLVLQELLEDAALNGYDFVYYYLDSDDVIRFDVANAISTIEVVNSNNERERIIRYYSRENVDETGQVITNHFAELWTKEETHYYSAKGDSEYKLETNRLNPRPHILKQNTETGELKGKGFDQLPFIKLSNNKGETTDLEPIKALIDDYDLMACSLSNNLVDFDSPIYAVKGFPGDNLDELVTNLNAKKTIGLDADENSGLEVKTVDIPVEARKAKLAIDKEAIYKFGMAFDSSQSGDGNITNIVIKSRYTLLDLKCNQVEIRLRRVIRQMIELVVQNINDRTGSDYDASKVKIDIIRDTMANETDTANKEYLESQTLQMLISSIVLATPYLDSETIIRLICTRFELDYEDVQKAIEEEDIGEFEGDEDETEPLAT